MTDDRVRGRMRLYLGPAPGVGKTFAMLSEGHRRSARGTVVLAGLVETHGRGPVTELLSGLETVPPRVIETPGGPVDELDVEALLGRRPDVVLVDELGHTNQPGARNPKRWQDVAELLDAGIDVISTLNIEHLESLTDVVESITGVEQRDTVPDHFVRAAEQIELVDMTPEALRRRLAHGNIYPADRIDAALSRYFRVGNLAALRELALLWLADRVDERLERYRQDHDIESIWATRELVLVALTGGPESDLLLRRGARIASRGAGGTLHAVHVSGRMTPSPTTAELARLRALTEELGGTHHTVVSDDVADAVLQLARSLNATQIVLGTSRRPRWRGVLDSGVSGRIIADSADIDVLVVTHPYARRVTVLPGRRGALGAHRLVAGWLLAVAGPLLLTLVLLPTRDDTTLALEAMSFLAFTVVCALVGGLWPALTAAVVGSQLLNWFFTPPYYTFTIADTVNVVALALFLLVAAAVASVVDKAARRSIQAYVAGREADTLTMLNRTLLRSDHDVQTLLDLVVRTFAVESAALLRRTDGEWEALARAGEHPPSMPDEADATADVSPALVLALRGAALPLHQRRVLAAFATHLAAVLERQELSARADEAQILEEGNRVRTALLAAVSHDLRTPLAGIKAAVSSLRSPDVNWSPADEAELLAAIEESADHLHSIVTNLLDLSRLQTGGIRPTTHEIGLDDVVSRTLAEMPQASGVEVRAPEDLPSVVADAGLLDRVIANLLDNALRHSPEGCPVTVSMSRVGDRVQLHVVDHGLGVPDAEKERMFAAFQRLGDARGRDGIGLGLAVAKGLTEALGGLLIAEDTPGGGLTMVVDLPAVSAAEHQRLHGATRP